mgnify:FL=1
MKKIVITGGAGFIGSHIVNYFYNTYKKSHIVVIDKLTYAGNLNNLGPLLRNKRVKFVKADICNYKIMKDALSKTDLLINAAAESHVDNSYGNSKIFSKTNIIGTHTLLEASRYNRVKKIIHISTDEVYGDIRKGKCNEEAHLNPTNPYSASKAAAEMIVKSYINSYKLPIIVLRPNNIYGIRQFPEKLIPKSIYLLSKLKKVPLHGNGKNIRHYLSVNDFLTALNIVLKKGKNETYNVGSDISYTNFKIVNTICKYLKLNTEHYIEFVDDRPYNDSRYAIDYKKIKKLNWNNKHSLILDFPSLIDWYLKDLSRR